MPTTAPLRTSARILPAIAAMGAMTLLAGCGGTSTSAEKGSAEASLQLGWIANVENMGPYVALDEGFYAAEGVDLTITPGGPSVSVEPLVASGKALVGLGSADSVAKAILEGAPLKIVAVTLQTNPTSVMSLASAPVDTLQDLEGKRLCVQTSGVEIVKTVLTSNGVDPDSVEYVSAEFDPSPLVTGQCDAFLSSLTNQPITLAAQGVETTTFALSDYGYSVPGNVLIVSDETLADPDARATVVKIIAATAKGWRAALDDTDAAAALMVDTYGKNQNLDLAQQQLAAKSYAGLVESDDTATGGLLSISDASVEANIATLEMLGVDITAEQLFDTSLLADAKPVK